MKRFDCLKALAAVAVTGHKRILHSRPLCDCVQIAGLSVDLPQTEGRSVRINRRNEEIDDE